MPPYPSTLIKFQSREFEVFGFDNKDHIFNSWKKSGCFYEEGLLNVVADLKLGGCYIDAGANVGNHTIFFSEFCSCDEIISVEASPEIFEILRLNCKNLVSTTCVTVNKCVYSNDGLKASSPKINPANCGDTVFTVDDTGTVGTTTLDSLAEGRDVSLIKLDIQGGELNALYGASDVLGRCSPALIIEAETKDEFQPINEHLSELGYMRASGSLATTPTFLWLAARYRNMSRPLYIT